MSRSARPSPSIGLHSLPLFVRLADRPVILLGDGDAADAKRRLLDRAGASIVGEDAPAVLAIVAIEDEGDALAAIARLKARGILVNAVDRPEHCDFTLPAIVDRDPVIVAIGTGGVSAGLAAALRQYLEQLLSPKLGALAHHLAAARTELRRAFPDQAVRRRAIARALAPGGALDLTDPSPDDPFWIAPAWIDDAGNAVTRATAYLRLGSGDPDALTLRDARLLANADRVTFRANVPSTILDRARADAVRLCTDASGDDGFPGLTVDVEMQ